MVSPFVASARLLASQGPECKRRAVDQSDERLQAVVLNRKRAIGRS
jgi:hypothetical protein